MSVALSVGRADFAALKTPLLALPFATGESLSAALAPLDRALRGALSRTLERRDFRGARDEVLHLEGTPNGPGRILLVGLGKAANRATSLRRAAALIGRRANSMGVGALCWYAGAATTEEVEQVGVGVDLGAWE